MSDTSNNTLPIDYLLSPTEVAALFQVTPKTVTRWAEAGKLSAVRTLGGHRRYKQPEVLALLNSSRKDRTEEIPMSDEKPQVTVAHNIQDALAFREALFSTGLDKPEGKAETVVIEIVEPGPVEPNPVEPDPFEGIESVKTDGFVLVSVYLPGELVDIHKIIVNAYYFANRKDAEKRKRDILKKNQEEPPTGLQILRIRPLFDGEHVPWHSQEG